MDRTGQTALLHELQQIRVQTVEPTQHNALYAHDPKELRPRVPSTAPWRGGREEEEEEEKEEEEVWEHHQQKSCHEFVIVILHT